MNKKGWKTAEKNVSTSFWVHAAPKSGRNTQQRGVKFWKKLAAKKQSSQPTLRSYGSVPCNLVTKFNKGTLHLLGNTLYQEFA